MTRFFLLFGVCAALGLASEAQAQHIAYSVVDGNRAVRVTVQSPPDAREVQEVEIPSGTVVGSSDGVSQDLVLGQTLTFRVQPGRTETREVATYCIDSARAVPQNGLAMARETLVDPNLTRLAALTGSMPHHVVQAAVWSYRDGEPSYDAMVRKALESAHVSVKSSR